MTVVVFVFEGGKGRKVARDAIVELCRKPGQIAEIAVDEAVELRSDGIEAIVEALHPSVAARTEMRVERAKGIHAGIDFITDGSAGRLFVDVVDGPADGVEARHDRGRAFQELDLLQAGSIHPTGGDVRWSDPNSVVEDVDLGAAEAPHGETGRRGGAVAGQHPHRALGGVCRGVIALLMNGLLVDDLDRRRGLDDRQPQARGALGHGIEGRHRNSRKRLRRG